MECPICGRGIGSLGEYAKNRHVEVCLGVEGADLGGEGSAGSEDVMELGAREETECLKVCPYADCGHPVPAEEWDDHQFAHLLQLQVAAPVEEQRQVDYAHRQLQERYGISTGGTNKLEGFIAQTVTDLEKQVSANKISPAEFHSRKQELLANASTGLDDLATCTQDVVSSLEQYYLAVHRPRGLSSVSLCGDVWHFCSSKGDIGWGCGYRNMQILLSCLLQLEPYKSHLAQKGILGVPSIPKLQNMIEDAWAQGFDAKGCEELQGKVFKTKKWIGTTEIASVLRNINIRALVVDFAEPSGPKGTHPKLLQWTKDYFHGRVQIQREGGGGGGGGVPDDIDYPPLYFQHEGHSRTIVGMEERGEDVVLLVLDPLHSPQQMAAVLRDPVKCMRLLRKSVHQIKEKEYEIVFVDGIFPEEEKERMKVIHPFQRFPP